MLDGESVIDARGRVRELSLALPGRANRSNAVVALAVADYFGVDLDQALPRLREVTSVAGRYTQLERDGRRLRLLLAKNPAGWLEAFDVLAPTPTPVLLAVNAQVPDGKDTSWLWDVDYRLLRGRPVLVAGERRLDLAVRLEADQVAFELADDVSRRRGPGAPGALDVIANYTAFQQIRTALGRPSEAERPCTERPTPRAEARVGRARGRHRAAAPSRRRAALRLIWVYPDLLSTYGDRGNLLVLQRRARLRGIEAEAISVNADEPVPSSPATST